jgi:predicted nucleotidyltransferase component of viral defense system
MNGRATSLKTKIRNLGKEKNIPAQVIMQNYMFERLLMRLSLSEYKDKFVLKGGLLIASIIGWDNRATMDMDTTLRRLPLTPESIRTAVQDVCVIDIGDEITFTVQSITPIRDDDVYGGYRVMLNAKYDTILISMSIDVTMGDIMTPQAIKHTFTGLFDKGLSFDLWAYNIETILAEKVETILRRNVLCTRPRDFYDIYILCATQVYDKNLFLSALKATASHRGTLEQISDITLLLQMINDSKALHDLWEDYRKQFPYAVNINYEMIMDVLHKILPDNIRLGERGDLNGDTEHQEEHRHS